MKWHQETVKDLESYEWAETSKEHLQFLYFSTYNIKSDLKFLKVNLQKMNVKNQKAVQRDQDSQKGVFYSKKENQQKPKPKPKAKQNQNKQKPPTSYR